MEQPKRKNKLRDRANGKADNKPASVGDEPAEGPDAYYLLKDFDSPAIYTALMEENEVQLNLIVRLEGNLPEPSGGNEKQTSAGAMHSTSSDLMADAHRSTPPEKVSLGRTLTTTRNTKDPILSALHQAALRAGPASLWKQLAWQDVPCAEASDHRELFDVIAKHIYALLVKRRAHDGFYARDIVIAVPDIEPASATRNDVRYYRHLLGAAPTEKALTIDFLLGVVLEQVARTALIEDADEGAEEPDGSMEQVGMLKQYFEKTVAKLALGRGEGPLSFEKRAGDAPASKAHMSGQNPNSYRISTSEALSITVPHADTHSVTARQLEPLQTLGLNAMEILRAIREILPMTRYPKTFADLSRARAPDRDLLAREQLLAETSLRSLAAELRPGDVERALLQFELEDMVRGRWGPPSRAAAEADGAAGAAGGDGDREEGLLDAWCWVEDFDEPTLVQVLQEARILRPKICTKLSSRDGNLLVAMMGPGPTGSKIWDEYWDTQVKTKVGFGLFYSLIDTKPHFLDPARPETLKRTPPYVYATGDDIIQYHDDCTTMYPCTGAQIRVRKTSSMNYGDAVDIHQTIHWNDNILTWGPPAAFRSTGDGAHLVAAFRDGSAFSIAPSGPTSVSAQMSTKEGLTVQFLPNGHIVQKILTARGAARAGLVARETNPAEIGRIVMPNGTIIKYFEDDIIHILYPNGNVSIRKSNQWTTITGEGLQPAHEVASSIPAPTVALTPTASPQLTPISPSPSQSLPPPLLKVIHERHPALRRTVITREDMVTVTVSEDGRVIAEHSDGTIIETDPASGTIHVRGVGFGEVVCGGEKGSRVMFGDGGVVERDSDGKFIVHKSDGTLEVEPTGTAVYSPYTAHTPDPDEAKHEYRVNWLEGTLHATDPAGYVFSVKKDGEAKATPPTTPPASHYIPSPSPGTLVTTLTHGHPATPSIPPGNTPRLFVLREDGTGCELLRDTDLVDYLCDQVHDQHAEVSEECAVDGGGFTVVTVIEGSAGSGGVGGALDDEDEGIVVHRQLARYEPLAAPLRTRIRGILAAHDEFMRAQNVTSDDSVNPVDASAGPASNPRRPRMFTFGDDRAATEEAIISRYMLKEERCLSARMGDHEVRTRYRGGLRMWFS
ncbi:hypothetical protein BDK51DRAFT_38526 [Blyttiomyces helicus]|uniref:Uncharacterized protein n=1 Tax=Blyttiomyces helicus TaxID=388810 RepID=A0A4P9W5M0_9FUNG|nr:hypothetical protein BDK51DRAFT_38526 [Blyttiomyces helicus]|eukprot:RKO87711.1 hypothetical protein BDK51DRAFT_38526 [Blyttiomyces helicus]